MSKLLDFNSTIWDKDINEVVASLRKQGISDFTISSTASGVVNTIALFEANGAKLQGLVNIKDGIGTARPAFLMKVI